MKLVVAEQSREVSTSFLSVSSMFSKCRQTSFAETAEFDVKINLHPTNSANHSLAGDTHDIGACISRTISSEVTCRNTCTCSSNMKQMNASIQPLLLGGEIACIWLEMRVGGERDTSN